MFYPVVRRQGGKLAEDVLEGLEEHRAVEILDEIGEQMQRRYEELKAAS